MIWLKRVVIVILILVLSGTLSLLQPAPAAAQQPVDQRFGAVESFWAPREAAELGVGWERILFYWNEIQPTGPNDWNTLHVLEEWLHEANAHNRTVVGVLKNSPGWATDSPYASGVPRGLYLPDDDPNNLWANYVRRVVQYYAPLGVHNWTIWNEPDIAPGTYGHEFSGTMADYYQLMKVSYRVIKQHDPTATVHLGGMTYWHDPGYLGRYLGLVAADPTAAENNYYFDVISLHVYFRPETIQLIVGSAFAAQQAAGITPMKAVWVNETNARPSMDPEWPVQVQSFTVDLDQQGWFIIQAFALGFAAGAGRISVYKLVDVNLPPGGESWGLIRPHDFSKRPAFYAYQTLIKHTAGFTYPVRRQQEPTHFIVGFQRPQGMTRVLWTRTQAPVTVLLPALADSATLVSATGQEQTITAENGVYRLDLEGARCYGECYMGGAPVFVVEQGVSVEVLPTAPPASLLPTATPTLTVTATLTPTLTATASATPTSTSEPTATPTMTPTATATPEPTATETAVPLPTPSTTPLIEAGEEMEIETAVGTTAVGTTSVVPPMSGWLFLGSGLLLALGLFLFMRRRP